MARSSDGTGGNRLGGSISLSYPFSLVGWIYPTSVAAQRTYMRLESGSKAVKLYNVLGSAVLRMNVFDGSGTTTLVSGTMNLNAWNFFAATFTDASNYTLSLNNANLATGSTTRDVGTLTTTYAMGQNTNEAMVGSAAEYAIYDVVLTGTDVTTLYGGYSPILVGTPKYYWKILGDLSPEPDLMGLANLTIGGTLPQATHVSPIYYETLSIAATDATKAEG